MAYVCLCDTHINRTSVYKTNIMEFFYDILIHIKGLTKLPWRLKKKRFPARFNPFTTEARFYVLNAIAFST